MRAGTRAARSTGGGLDANMGRPLREAWRSLGMSPSKAKTEPNA